MYICIEYRPEINNFDFYHLKNNPEESLFKWDCRTSGSDPIFLRVNKRISFGTVPLHSLSKKIAMIYYVLFFIKIIII